MMCLLIGYLFPQVVVATVAFGLGINKATVRVSGNHSLEPTADTQANITFPSPAVAAARSSLFTIAYQSHWSRFTRSQAEQGGMVSPLTADCTTAPRMQSVSRLRLSHCHRTA